MTYIDAFNIIEAFRHKLESELKQELEVKENSYITLDIAVCKEILEALDTVDY